MAEIETTTGGNSTGSKIKALVDVAKKVKVVTDFSVEALAEIEEADASIKKLHEEYFYTVNSWAYRQSTRMGKPASELKQSDISFAEFFKTQGLSVDQYTQLSMEFAELSFDISTKYGLSVENANELLKAAVQREEYALKFLNINLKNSSLNGFSNSESTQNVANIILKETSGIRGSTEQDIKGYTDAKAMAVEATKEVMGRTVGVVFEPLYTDLLNAYNDQINQAKLSLQIHSEKKIDDTVRNQEMKIKDDVAEYKRLMDLVETRPEFQKQADQQREKLAQIFPEFMKTVPHSKEGADALYNNLDPLLKELSSITREIFEDQNFEIKNQKLSLKYESEIKKINKKNQASKEHFNNIYHFDPDTILKDSKLNSLLEKYNQMQNNNFGYNIPQRDIDKIKTEIVKELSSNDIVNSSDSQFINYAKTTDNYDGVIRDLANHQKIASDSKKRALEMEKEAEEAFNKLWFDYAAERNPFVEHTKYLSEEYFPGIIKNNQENNKKIEKEKKKIEKEKESFKKTFGASYDEVLKIPEVSNLLQKLNTNYNDTDYMKLSNILANSGQIKKVGFLENNSTFGLMTRYKVISNSESNIVKYQKAIKEYQTTAGKALQTFTQNIFSPESLKNAKPMKYSREKTTDTVAGVLISLPKLVTAASDLTSNNQNQAKDQTVQKRVVRQPQRTAVYREPTKWEVMSKELKKAVKDLTSKAGKMGDVILNTSDKLAKLELEKLHKFSAALGMSESEVLFQEIAILEKQRQIAVEVGKKEKVESLTAEIKEKKKRAENAKFYDDMINSYEQKSDMLDFKPSEQQTIDFQKKFDDFYGKKLEELKRMLNYGIISQENFDKEANQLRQDNIRELTNIKKLDEVKSLVIENFTAELSSIFKEADKASDFNKLKGELFGLDESETLKTELDILTKEREQIIVQSFEFKQQHKDRTSEIIQKEIEENDRKRTEALANGNFEIIEKLKKENENLNNEKILADPRELINEYNEEIGKVKNLYDPAALKTILKTTIENAFKDVNPRDLKSGLQNTVHKIFEDTFNANPEFKNVYHDKYNEQFSSTIAEELKSIHPTGNFAKDQLAYNEALCNALIKVSKSGDEASRALANFMIVENIKGNLDDLSKSLSNAGSILKDDFLTNMSVTMSSISGLLGQLQESPYIGSGMGNFLGGVTSFLGPASSIINTVLGVVGGGVSLFRSFGISGNKYKKHNEEEKRKTNDWYENKSKENENLFREISSLTNSIQNLTTKLIQNIASDTSDKNIAKQSNYYNTLIDKTGDLYDGQITATGHSSKKKGIFGGKKNSHATLSQGFDEYFGDAWKNTARDSASLQRFYDTYIQNFDLNTLKRKLGKSKLDNNNLEEVKSSFLRFIQDVRVMEQYSANLPKNGILESFEGVEVADLFELRNEYQKQLEDIYKGMGKDPEKYRDEILNTVNSLIQNEQVIISAFQDVKSRTIEQISGGNDMIMSLANGLEGYFGKLKTNFSKVFYDLNFQGFEEKFSTKFGDLTNKLADFRLSGRKDFDTFINENLNFWDLFNDLKNTQYLENDLKGIIDTLKNQAKSSGLSDEVINAMFPDDNINEKTDKIKNALETSIRKALDTNSFEQFSMSLGDSIYNNVKDSLVKAFYESQSFQALADKYFLTEEYKNALDNAGSFKEAYDIIRNKLDEVELKLQSEGMDFKGTNAADGDYYGMSGKQEYKTSGILDNSKGVEFAVTLNNYGFMSNSEFMNTLKKEMKEFLYESGKEEV